MEMYFVGLFDDIIDGYTIRNARLLLVAKQTILLMNHVLTT
jgi:hypothetical protein